MPVRALERPVRTDKVRLPFPLASMATWDPATELESARALRALDPAAVWAVREGLAAPPG